VRLFVAVDPSASARDHLIARLRQPSLHDPSLPLDRVVRWTPPEQWHVTLAFLADVRNSEIAELSENLARTAQLLTGIPVGLAGAGAFPRPARATTLWCGIDPGGSELSIVAAAVASAIRATGLSLDDRPFRPHLTLARCQPTDLRPIVSRLADYRGPQFPVAETVLVRSHLGKGPDGRAAHEVIGSWRFGTA